METISIGIIDEKAIALLNNLEKRNLIKIKKSVFYEMPLFTLNIKDFKYIDGVNLWV